jgi:hypothetical protein
MEDYRDPDRRKVFYRKYGRWAVSAATSAAGIRVGLKIGFQL